MDDLRIMLVIVGCFAVLAVLIHGFWVNKRERSSFFERNDQKRSSINSENKKDKTKQQEPEITVTDLSNFDNNNDPLLKQLVKIRPIYTETGVDVDIEKGTTFNPYETDPIQQANTINTAVVPAPVAEIEQTIQFIPADEVYTKNLYEAEEYVESSISSVEHETLSSGNEAKIKSSFHSGSGNDDQSSAYLEQEREEKLSQQTLQPEVKTKKQDIISMHVTPMGDGLFEGHQIYNSVLRAGFTYGDMQIFHRYSNSIENSGPVLFSLANILKPGTFDLQSIYKMTTSGITVFMVVPSEEDNLHNFKLMLQAVQQIADEMGGVVLDENHNILTPQKINEYKDRIRDVIRHNEEMTN